MDPKSLSEPFQVILGEKLSSVTFVMDYWQLDFDGHGFSIFTRNARVRSADRVVQDGEDQFRNRLCERIAKVVVRVELTDESLVIEFDDRSQIDVSLRDEDYVCPEALTFRSYKFDTLYVI